MTTNRAWGILLAFVFLPKAPAGIAGDMESCLRIPTPPGPRAAGLGAQVIQRSTHPGTAPSTASVPKLRRGPSVVIVLRQDNAPLASVVGLAKLTATRIFAGIGVPVVWRTRAGHPAKAEAAVIVEMQLDARVPEDLHPGALAYATPYAASGTRIHVLCDRVLKGSSREIQGPLLGHVMAHEIAHVLTGSDRHSVEGVMQAHWDSQDYHQMISRVLLFDATAAELIHAALEKWLRDDSPAAR